MLTVFHGKERNNGILKIVSVTEGTRNYKEGGIVIIKRKFLESLELFTQSER